MMPLDLTLTISENIPTFPGSPKPQFIPWSKITTDQYNLELLFLSSHTGTHIDAPFHFIQKGSKIHQIPVKRLVSEAILIKIKKGENQPINKNDIINFEKHHKEIPKNSTVIFHTGWQKNKNKEYFFYKNPGLSSIAAIYLASKKVNLVGIDSPSIDLGSDKKFSAHKILAKNNILIVENLVNLEKIKRITFQLVILPLKLENATGSPVRAIAI